MRILCLADEESKYLWDFYEPWKFDGIDLVLAAGDLKPEYLSFIVTLAHCPVLYVCGNHDHYDEFPPEGCICIEDEIYEYKGVRILGLGGSMRYRQGPFQYTEQEMARRIIRLAPKLYAKQGFDILLTHAPAYELNDGEDICHRGFFCFLGLLQTYKPKYFVHGHVHKTYGRKFKTVDHFGETTVINAYERYIIEIEPDGRTEKERRKTPEFSYSDIYRPVLEKYRDFVDGQMEKIDPKNWMEKLNPDNWADIWNPDKWDTKK